MTSRVLLVDLLSSSVNWALPDSGARRIVAEAPDGWQVRFVESATVSDGDGNDAPSDEVLAKIADAEVYFGFGISRTLFAAAPRLRWVQSASAGVAASLHQGMRESDVVLTNAAGLMAIPIAEHVVGGVLHFLRGFDIAIQRYREGAWDKGPFASGDLLREAGECRALIVGAGGIGSAIAQRLSALGMPCVGVRRRVELGAPAGFERVVPLAALDDELPQADVLVLATAHTKETRGMLSAARMDLLPGQAIVANVARGALLDEAALAERLQSGRLRGAILDVFSREPLPAESPLWGIGPMLFTPHVSAISPRRFWERQLDLFLDNWRRYGRGEPLANVVDKDAGY